jgi:DNA-directed RNA polymerase specialized sigma24 family protein
MALLQKQSLRNRSGREETMQTIRINDPLMDRSMSGWIVNEARRNYWRVARWYDLADLVQDGYLSYAKCKARYGHLFNNPPTKGERKWFMALVQRTFHNHIYDLAMEKTHCPEVTEAWLAEKEEKQAASVPANDIADAAAVLLRAPAEIGALIAALARDINEGYRRSHLRTRTKVTVAYGAKGTAHASQSTRVMKGRKGLRETTGEFYRRIVGAGEGVDLRAWIEENLA